MGTRLVVALHGISGGAELEDCARFARALEDRAVALCPLLRPAVLDDPAVADWVVRRAALGDAVVLHGLGGTPGLGRAPHSLPEHEARLWLSAALLPFERLGLRVVSFAATGDRVCSGFLRALWDFGFVLCVSPAGLRHPWSGGTRRLPTRGSAGGRWPWSRARSGMRRACSGGGSPVRLAVSAADLCVPRGRAAALAAVDRALEDGAVPVTYPELGTPSPAPSPGGGVRGGRVNPDPLTR
ncbi:hypothetical protein [Actinopolyspora mortivallis]|uniref:hypothetical protein n=1 Tax=Actinopolyspora mortivallis TaxID=33906 RepID=UPI0012ECF915|nr:hypothetical protein [Actinopolyspora mortivallis]